MRGYSDEKVENCRKRFYEKTRLGLFPVGITAFIAVVMLGLLYVL